MDSGEQPFDPYAETKENIHHGKVRKRGRCALRRAWDSHSRFGLIYLLLVLRKSLFGKTRYIPTIVGINADNLSPLVPVLLIPPVTSKARPKLSSTDPTAIRQAG